MITTKKKYEMKKHSVPIVRQLEEKYGGEWKYIRWSGTWECEELDMHACYVVEGYDMNGNPVSSPLSFKPLRIYGNGKRGEAFFPKRMVLKKKE